MIDFIEYVVSELKSKRLSKADARDLIRDYSGNAAPAPRLAMLHPLLHRNVSDIDGSRYVSSFDGSEFFLRDHQVMAEGDRAVSVLPGVACLEMVRAAVADACMGGDAGQRLRIDDVVWLKPIVVAARKDLFIALSADATEGGDRCALEFEIFSEESCADGQVQDIVHCRGSARFAACDAPARLDLRALQARMAEGELDASAVYPAYRRMGMKFGPAHQPIRRVLRGQGEAVAHLTLPEAICDTWGDYALHPSLLDGALQASIGLLRDLQCLPDQPPVPFALDSLRMYSACRQDMVVWVRHAPGGTPDDKVSRLDIDLCDSEGNVCVRLSGFCSRTLGVGSADGSRPAADEPLGLLLAAPVWKPSEKPAPAPSKGVRHHVLWCGDGALGARTRSLMPHVAFREVPAQSAGLASRFIDTALGCFAAVRKIIEDKSGGDAFVHVVAPAEPAPLLSALSGLLKSAALEDPRLNGQLLLVDERMVPEQIAECIRCEVGCTQDAVLRYRDGIREVLGWQEHEAVAEPRVAFKEGGVYLVTGGLGGLGTLFAKEILRQTARAKVILTGRADASEKIEEKLRALDAPDALERRAAYHAVDLTDLAQVRRLVAEIDAEHGGLDGVLHCAGMFADGLIANKSGETFARVLAPKVTGTFHLDLATVHEDLDFVALFSSGASVMGNAGQSDYAVANGFLDQFAQLRNGWVESGHRKGKTVAINWPLWQDGGMRMPARAQDAMKEATGMLAMQTTTGLHAFYCCLQAPRAQTVVIEGQLQKMRRTVFGAGQHAPAAAVSTPAASRAIQQAGVADEGLAERTSDYLRRQFAHLLKLPFDKMDPQAPLENYGFDSILAMDLTRTLEKTFGPLSKTLLFEHQTIDELIGYFLASHAPALVSMFQPQPASSPMPAGQPATRGRSRRARSPEAPRSQAIAADEPIAIVGLSGRYPESDDLQAFWHNLRDGKDCITEIPKARWDWRDYFSDDRSAAGCHFSKWGGFISGVDEFDPLFFNIPPVDAEMIDPQERLFLQHAWMAIEDAGYTRKSLQNAPDDAQAGQVGVYVGVMYGEHQLFGAEASRQGTRLGVPGSYASIANRVSYVLDVHGPSMTVDTMCSSSLTAIHLASQDLKLGRTHLAIAGGVNVTIHPNKYLILSAGQYISGDGHCQSFGVGGDGYIPGEGVGAVVLKRLSDAERDGNHIYGVIRASALNHGGKTNGYSVPNPKAQSAVIARALKASGIDARQVSYVEAHGTGTKLGDPIEIAALSQVFRQVAPEGQFCAIGSAKSNIGHCESAAGIAGLTKVLLQMQHRQIVPSLHSSVLNPHIDFESSPFYVNQTLRSWEPPVVDGRPVPRIAGISSFGAGGSNAHVIVEEHVDERASPPAMRSQTVVVLSARTGDQLKQKMRDLLAFIQSQQAALDLASLSYTLQVGREAMDFRLALLVDSVSQLTEKLETLARGDADIDLCFQGQVDPEAQALRLLGQDEDMKEAVDKWIARGKLSRLAELWVKGLVLDWAGLWGKRKPRLMSLPTYPFAKDRYWVGDRVRDGALHRAAPAAKGMALHPLLHANTSDFFQQSYTAEFTGDEFFLADHQIETGTGRRKVLPAVALLEMARAAIDHSVPAQPGSRMLQIRDVVWIRPVMVKGLAQVSIVLSFNGEDLIDVEWRSESDAADGPVVHGQAQVVLAGVASCPPLEIGDLRSRMSGERTEPERLYAGFQSMGIHYGPSFRSVADLRRGPDQVLAELVLPHAARAGFDDYALHPSLLDGALQACIGLAGAADGLPDRPAVPFALDTLTLMAPFAPRMFAWVRRAASAAQQEGLRKIDIDLCDEQGRVCAQLAGLALRPLQSGPQADTLLALPTWEPAAHEGPAAAREWQRRIVLSALDGVDPQALAGHLPGAQVRSLPRGGDESLAEAYRATALACFEQLQAILQAAPQEAVLVQVVIGGSGKDRLFAGLSGLIKTARLENPNLVGQLVLANDPVDARTLARHLQALHHRPDEMLFSIQHAKPSTLQWQVQDAREAQKAAYRVGGVYLISGGLGGLGVLFARDILQRAPGAAVVLAGRAEGSPERLRALQSLCAELSVPLDRLVYRRLDLGRLDAVESLVAEVVAEFGGLHGVIHAAGMTRDGWMIRKTAEEFAGVLAPKVAGTVHLDLATQRIDLDFFALFSSVAASVGNAGQADYAAANGFMDQFAAYRNTLAAEGQRSGHTISIGWPLWAEGGMRLDAQAQALLAQASGMVPMQTGAGLQAFHRCMELGESHVLVMAGDVQRLGRALRDRHAGAADAAPAVSPAPLALPPAAADPAAEPAADSGVGSLQLALQRELKQQFADLLKMPPHEVDAKAPLDRYGMDSVLAMKLTNQLERSFGSLSKTLFFEYQTIAALAGYLVKAFPEVVRRMTGSDAGQGVRLLARAPSRPVLPMHGKLRRIEPAARIDDDVAIIGIAGRYPQARNLREFWHNLKSGRDCITEIPSERWDHASLFHPARNQPGKSYSKWGGFLSDVDRFDALFFSISPREAELIDPQERLFIETVWETIEDAGYSKDEIARRRVGVYVGAMWGQYELYGATSAGRGVPSSSFASIANRVSYFFNFQGPSLALDTMCSSSLTAIHLACEAVRKGEIDVAVAGGVNVTIHPQKYLSLSQGNFASTDGRCRAFGDGGDGYVPGEGVGAVLLKPLRQALADGDQIHAVIKGSAINHGGKTNGYTVPNPVAQAELIVDALNKARVDPATIGCVETHGTGTSLGDPIEINGLVRAFEAAAGEGAARAKASCAIGSVKSNIGHLESAAGIASVTKALLQLKHRQLVPSLHAQQLNPHIDFVRTRFHVQRELQEWTVPPGAARRVAVSSFGAGGSNAHLILEEFVDTRAPAPRHDRPEIFVLSAKTRDRLCEAVSRAIEFLQDTPETALTDIAFTSQVGRTPMSERLAVVAASAAAVKDKLQRWLAEASSKPSGAVEIEDVHEGNAREASKAGALLEGDAGRMFVAMMVQQRDLARLSRLWVSGVEVDWAALHGMDRPRRVSLPTYPFLRERHWIDAPAAVMAPALAEAVPAQSRQMLSCRNEWIPASLADVQGRSSVEAIGPILCLGADDDLLAQLRREANGAAIVAVAYGDAYQRLGPDRFCVAARSDSGFVSLIDDLKAMGAMPSAIVHIADAAPGLHEALDRGVYALHGLFRAMMTHKHNAGVKVVSLQSGVSGDQAALHRALTGYLKSLAIENPRFAWKVISLQGAAGAEDTARIVSQELRETSWRDSAVRYDAGLSRREVSTVKRSVPPVGNAGAAIRQRGVYIVTGGLGGLGAVFSEHLAKEYGARLVLTGRSPLDDASQRKLAALSAFGSGDGDIVYCQADVSDPHQAASVVAEAKRRFGGLHGVVHCAGIHRDAFALNKTRDDMASVLAAKVMGTLNLDRLTKDEDLDLFAMFSSVAGAFGNAGQCDYAFANGFLDAFAEQRSAWVASGQRRGKTLSIAWPLWQDGGMQISRADTERLEQRSGLSPLPTPQGLQFWDRFLQSDDEFGIALYGDAARIDAWLQSRSMPKQTPTPVPLPAPSTMVRAEAAPSLCEATENYLKSLLSDEIKLPVDRIDSEERFEAFGVDSMMVSRINAGLERDLGELPKTLFYEYATIEELAAYLIEQAQPALARHFAASAPAHHPVCVPEPKAPVHLPAVQAQAQPSPTPNDDNDKIAIIGVHVHFPGSPSLAEYWRNLSEGRDLVGLVPPSRWDREALFDADPANAAKGKIYCKWGGFLDDVDKFDAPFFSIGKDDARMIDPQERLFIQSVWSAVEDAGYTRDSLKKRHAKGKSADVGVFVGVTTNSYHLLAPEECSRGNMVSPGSLPWSIANRVSYFFDFQGPSMPIDTACSSSLVAIHLACESLKSKQCQVAVAGGVNLYLHPSKYQSLCRRRMLARDGKCRSYGDGDDGFIPGEGVGTLLLKPLSKAIEDGDHVYGVVAASVCEHSGRSNGYSAPNPNSQAMLIEQALSKAGSNPESIGYVEGHGTGTQLGDSLEIVSLTQAFGKHTNKTRYCALGSVKANVGHAESAAGIAGVAKILLQFKHRQIAPTIHSERVNPNIDFEHSPFQLQHALSPWEAPAGQPLRALVNSFGAGGVNSCLILEAHEAPRAPRVPEGDKRAGTHLVVLSARNEARLKESAARLLGHLQANRDEVDLSELSHTLQVGREAMEERLALVVSGADDLTQELSAYLAGAPSAHRVAGRVEPNRRKKSRKGHGDEPAKLLFEQGDWRALAQLWVENRDIDWELFYCEAHPRRMSLPTYPFAKERYWVSDAAVSTQPQAVEPKPARLHPLVDGNTSTLREVCFASSLTGRHYYGRDHMVKGESFFPGAGFLEMACVAGTIAGEGSVTRIEDIVWSQPLRLADAGQAVKTFLRPDGNGAAFSIVSFDEDNERVAHAEGQVFYGDRAHSRAEDAVSIQALTERAGKAVQGADCYQMLEGFGFGYGPCFQTIQELHVGTDFALSRLSLADELKDDFEQYLLHPCLIDGALQTVVGLAIGNEPHTPHVPFALSAVEIIKPLTQTCYAHVEEVRQPRHSEVKQFDIRLLSERGEVLVKLNRFCVRALRHAGSGTSNARIAAKP